MRSVMDDGRTTLPNLIIGTPGHNTRAGIPLERSCSTAMADRGIKRAVVLSSNVSADIRPEKGIYRANEDPDAKVFKRGQKNPPSEVFEGRGIP